MRGFYLSVQRVLRMAVMFLMLAFLAYGIWDYSCIYGSEGAAEELFVENTETQGTEIKWEVNEKMIA